MLGFEKKKWWEGGMGSFVLILPIIHHPQYYILSAKWPHKSEVSYIYILISYPRLGWHHYIIQTPSGEHSPWILLAENIAKSQQNNTIHWKVKFLKRFNANFMNFKCTGCFKYSNEFRKNDLIIQSLNSLVSLCLPLNK